MDTEEYLDLYAGKKYGLTMKDFIGSGGSGGAAYKYEGKVLKFTGDIEEINKLKILQKKNSNYFAKIYFLKKIPVPKYADDGFEYYIVIKEYLYSLSEKEMKVINLVYEYPEKIKSLLKQSENETDKKFINSLYKKYNKMRSELLSMLGKSFVNGLDLKAENVGWKKDGTLAAFDI